MRQAGHEQVILNHHKKRMSGTAIKAEAASNATRKVSAHFGVIAVTLRFAHVMKKQSQIEKKRPVQSMK